VFLPNSVCMGTATKHNAKARYENVATVSRVHGCGGGPKGPETRVTRLGDFSPIGWLCT
jgi:hypothetical protein